MLLSFEPVARQNVKELFSHSRVKPLDKPGIRGDSCFGNASHYRAVVSPKAAGSLTHTGANAPHLPEAAIAISD
jgi:hypothetical protein